MTVVHLVRHGAHDALHTLSGRSDIALSAAGRAEVGRLADRLAARPVARVQASPRRRTVESAALIAERHGLAVEIIDALDEVDFGAWTGRSFSDLADDPAWRRWNDARGSAATPGGETMAAAVGRARAHLDAIEDDEPVVCITHCDIIRGAVATWLGLDLDRMLGFDCDPGSLTTVSLADGGGRILTLNERPQ